jgi:hypothetical protein
MKTAAIRGFFISWKGGDPEKGVVLPDTADSTMQKDGKDTQNC